MRPRYAPSDLPALLWRERRLMLTVFAVVLVVGIAFAFTFKTLYPAHSSVLVRLGQEYVYEPRSGDAGRGAVPAGNQVLESETDILGSDALKLQVVRDLGFGRLYPGKAHAFAVAAPQAQERMIGGAASAIGRRLDIATTPDTPVIRLTYSDPNPATAALVLNTLLADYLVYRRSVLLAPTTDALEAERKAFEDRLAQADAAYQNFLTTNQIGDFDAEKASLSQLQGQVEQQRYAAAAQLRERSGRLSALDAGLGQVPQEVGIYRDVDNSAANKLADLELQRESLLSRYQPGAQPVRDIDAQISQLRSAVDAGRAKGPGGVRTGANPVYQSLQTDTVQSAAELAAARQSLAALEGQQQQITQRRLRLAALEPTFRALSRDRDVLASNVRDFTVKEEQSQASQQIAATTNDDIRIVERAYPPTDGKSLRKSLMAMAFLFAGFCAVCAGLLRMVLRPGLPTPALAARTLELPVLGMAAMKA
ncbi:MAG TPA: lipopolysaccharide biosynthesis protein [Caulobacteraceae bacterium]